MVKLVKLGILLLFRFPNVFDNFVSSDFIFSPKVINSSFNCPFAFSYQTFDVALIHGKSLGLTVIILFGMDFSAAKTMASVMSLIF